MFYVLPSPFLNRNKLSRGTEYTATPVPNRWPTCIQLVYVQVHKAETAGANHVPSYRVTLSTRSNRTHMAECQTFANLTLCVEPYIIMDDLRNIKYASTALFIRECTLARPCVRVTRATHVKPPSP